MGAFPIAEAQLAALFMQSVAYGVHVVTFAACIYTWFHRSSNSHVSGCWPWMLVAVAFFVFGTCDVSFNLYHNLIAFIFYTGPGGADAEFDRLSTWVNVMRSVWFDLNIALSDAALIYRCWLVYAHSPRRAVVAIAPVVLWLGWISCAIIILYYICTLNAVTSIPSTDEIQPFLYAFYSLTLAINLFTTGLIILRLWRVHKRTSSFFTRSWRGPSRLSFADVTLIIIESALLYTTTVIICVVLDLANSNAYYGATDVSLEVAGISFDLIIIRIWTGVSTEQTQAFTDTVENLSKIKAGASEQVITAHSGFTDLNTCGFP
ncbi:uncharacterized protein B0H18DRAFT_1197943 [Fomitopsis serialis]|uniref:uncharacterized protein n=1 Tax=Fomitopsis serialis TaxID=139415 RepID=UPI0020086C1A|nr:uncharacterized protein B0H18DRAFT_1197943 [Neoantrodia serialis]KAH9905077.1 hypothetical protein B0H18DRAFT_1197943 [Neoantrodia serialis]